jgi:UDP-N-acetylmuramoyl-tripeptide--D-alanyl-D-alanine ligase
MGQRFRLVTSQGEAEAFLPAPGQHNLLNAMAATAVGLSQGLSLAEIAAAGGQRISVGGGLTWVAVSAFADAARAMRESGDFSSLGTRVPISDWLAER